MVLSPCVLAPKTFKAYPLVHEYLQKRRVLTTQVEVSQRSVSTTRRRVLCQSSSLPDSSPLQIGQGYLRDARVGVLGGGQLGRMMALAAVRIRLSLTTACCFEFREACAHHCRVYLLPEIRIESIVVL
jgi:hypothetical protein